jgi:hypothetical protein
MGKKTTEKNNKSDTTSSKAKGSGKSKASKEPVGSVAFVYGGGLKTGLSRLFWTEESNPLDKAKELSQHYGVDAKCKYVNCSDPEKVFNKALKDFEGVSGELVTQSVTDLSNNLKELAGAKVAHACELHEKKSAKSSAKKSKKVSDDEDEDEQEDAKDDDDDDKHESGDEISDAEDDKEDDDNEEDAEEDEEEEEKPTKSGKKSGKDSKEAKETKDNKKSKESKGKNSKKK